MDCVQRGRAVYFLTDASALLQSGCIERISAPFAIAAARERIFMRPIKKISLLMVLLGLNLTLALAQEKKLRDPDVIYVPTPQEVVDEMLKLADVHTGDVVYDLGCGDGRTVITAAKTYGVHAVGIDINPERIQESLDNAKKADVMDKVTFRNEDLFEADIHEATVVTLYLLRSLNLKLRPKLWHDLQPGTRIVSHAFDMGDWKPEKEIEVEGRRVFLWRVPPRTASVGR
jgi:SAM-dependent methyltransferase